MRVCVLEREEGDEQLCEPAIVIVAFWRVAIAPNPFRMLCEKRIVHLALQLDVGGSLNRETGKKSRVHVQHQTFSRCGIGLKIRFQLVSELKIDMFNTSIGSCRRQRGRNHRFDFLFDIFMA